MKLSSLCRETAVAITEVHQFDSAVCSEEDVVALHITVNYSVVVKMLKTLKIKQEKLESVSWA